MAGILSGDQAARGRLSTTSRSTRRATGSAGRGARTRIPGSRATSRRISTATRSRRTPTGATASRPAPRSARTSSASPASTASTAHRASARRSSAASFVDGRWQLETSVGTHDEVDVVIAATGVLHHPRVSGHRRASTRSPARCSTAPAGTTTRTLDGRARRHHRDRVDRGADRRPRSSIGSRTSRCSSARAQWIMPQENPPYTDEQKRGASASDPRQLRGAARAPRRAVRRCSPTRSSTPTPPQIKMIEDMCLANLEDNVTDPELRERLRPDYRAACKRLVVSPDFYEAIQHPNAELVTEAHRAHRAGRRAHRRRRAARARRARARDRLPGRRVHATDGRHRVATARRSTRRGPSGRTRTCRSRCPTSRTSSCSTGRTVRSATSR